MIKYRPYGNIELTEAGERIGRAVVRRHRIIETYLVTSLGMPWDQVHDEADRLEHAASEALVDRRTRSSDTRPRTRTATPSRGAGTSTTPGRC